MILQGYFQTCLIPTLVTDNAIKRFSDWVKKKAEYMLLVKDTTKMKQKENEAMGKDIKHKYV